ncbi:MAG: hypothetical protein Q8M94_07540 [Ignavibacteria bacterium]|nr:hypothetical protein [Ignavibacteria bacterium]
MPIEKKVDQEEPGEGAPIEQPETEGEAVKPEEVMVEIEGEKVPISQISEWRKDFENKSKWQKELTQKGQKISEDARLIERLKPMATYLDDPANVEKAKKIQSIVEGIEEAKQELPPVDEFEEPAITALRKRYDAEIAKLNKVVATIQRGSSDKEMADTLREIAQEEKEVKAKYKDLTEADIDFIGKISQSSGGENLVKVADTYVKHLQGRDKSTIKAYLEGKEKDKRSFTETGGLPPAPPERRLSL